MSTTILAGVAQTTLFASPAVTNVNCPKLRCLYTPHSAADTTTTTTTTTPIQCVVSESRVFKECPLHNHTSTHGIRAFLKVNGWCSTHDTYVDIFCLLE